jgi:galactose mutarotase-like enzyme
MLAIETVRLARGGAEAWLAPGRGGLLTRFSVDGEPLLYLDEGTLADATKNVRGGVPILFPVAGKPPAGSPLEQHGFARKLPWRVVEEGAERAVLGLDAGDATRALWPHEFSLRFSYALGDRSLSLEQRFENRGEAPMRIQPGLHPYFRVDEKAGARVATGATRAWDNLAGAERALAPIDFAAGEVDLHLLDHDAPGTRLLRPGAPDIILDWSDDQKVLVLWTLPGRPFICVEPWSDRAGGPGISVAPGEAHLSRLAISVAGAG